MKKKQKYELVYNGVVTDRQCLLMNSTGSIPTDSTGDTLVKVYAGNQVGGVIGEAVAGKTGQAIGSAVGALGASQLSSGTSFKPKVYCTYDITLDSGDKIRQIFHEDYVDTLGRSVSIVKFRTASSWWLVDRVVPLDQSLAPEGREVVGYQKMAETVDKLSSKNLDERMDAQRTLTTEYQCTSPSSLVLKK